MPCSALLPCTLRHLARKQTWLCVCLPTIQVGPTHIALYLLPPEEQQAGQHTATQSARGDTAAGGQEQIKTAMRAAPRSAASEEKQLMGTGLLRIDSIEPKYSAKPSIAAAAAALQGFQVMATSSGEEEDASDGESPAAREAGREVGSAPGSRDTVMTSAGRESSGGRVNVMDLDGGRSAAAIAAGGGGEAEEAEGVQDHPYPPATASAEAAAPATNGSPVLQSKEPCASRVCSRLPPSNSTQRPTASACRASLLPFSSTAAAPSVEVVGSFNTMAACPDAEEQHVQGHAEAAAVAAVSLPPEPASATLGVEVKPSSSGLVLAVTAPAAAAIDDRGEGGGGRESGASFGTVPQGRLGRVMAPPIVSSPKGGMLKGSDVCCREAAAKPTAVAAGVGDRDQRGVESLQLSGAVPAALRRGEAVDSLAPVTFGAKPEPSVGVKPEPSVNALAGGLGTWVQLGKGSVTPALAATARGLAATIVAGAALLSPSPPAAAAAAAAAMPAPATAAAAYLVAAPPAAGSKADAALKVTSATVLAGVATAHAAAPAAVPVTTAFAPATAVAEAAAAGSAPSAAAEAGTAPSATAEAKPAPGAAAKAGTAPLAAAEEETAPPVAADAATAPLAAAAEGRLGAPAAAEVKPPQLAAAEAKSVPLATAEAKTALKAAAKAGPAPSAAAKTGTAPLAAAEAETAPPAAAEGELGSPAAGEAKAPPAGDAAACDSPCGMEAPVIRPGPPSRAGLTLQSQLNHAALANAIEKEYPLQEGLPAVHLPAAPAAVAAEGLSTAGAATVAAIGYMTDVPKGSGRREHGKNSGPRREAEGIASNVSPGLHGTGAGPLTLAPRPVPRAAAIAPAGGAYVLSGMGKAQSADEGIAGAEKLQSGGGKFDGIIKDEPEATAAEPAARSRTAAGHGNPTSRTIAAPAAPIAPIGKQFRAGAESELNTYKQEESGQHCKGVSSVPSRPSAPGAAEGAREKGVLRFNTSRAASLAGVGAAVAVEGLVREVSDRSLGLKGTTAPAAAAAAVACNNAWVVAQEKKSAAAGDAVRHLVMGAVKSQRGGEDCEQGITAQAGAAVRCSDVIVISSDDEEEGEPTQHRQYKGLQQQEAGVGGGGKAASSDMGGAGIGMVKRSRSAASDQELVDTGITIPTAMCLVTGAGAADGTGLQTASVPAGAAVRLDHHAGAAAISKGIPAPATTATAAAAYGAVEAHIAEAAVAAPAEAEAEAGAAGGAGNTGTHEAPKQYILKDTDDVEEAAEQVLELCRGLKVEGVSSIVGWYDCCCKYVSCMSDSHKRLLELALLNHASVRLEMVAVS